MLEAKTPRVVRSSLIVAAIALAPAQVFAQTPPAAQPTQPAQAPKPKPKQPQKSDKTSGKQADSPTTGAASGTAPWGSPAAAADPPPIPPPPPPPWAGDTSSGPTSTAGTQLVPPGPPVAIGASEDPAIAAAREKRIQDLEARLAADEAHMKDHEAGSNDGPDAWWKHVHISGYVQPQLIVQVYNAAASPNLDANGNLPAGITPNDTIAKTDGTTTNGTFFRLRRARLKAELSPTDYAKMVFEIDPNLAGAAAPGSGTIARQVEAQGIAKVTKDIRLEFAMGIFKIPFSFEILQTDAERPFIERSWGEQNMYPNEFDDGARMKMNALDKKLDVQAAVLNGATIGEKNFAIVPDLNRSKDGVLRANYNFGPADVGIGGYLGEGQNIDPTNIRFKNFTRWAGNIEAALHQKFLPIGESRAFGEFDLAQNMDRGVHYTFALPPIPANITSDVVSKDERSTWIRLEQDITQWTTLGVRYDFYSPDTAQKNDGRDTYSFVGVVHFTKGLQLMLEFDHAIDNAHKPGAAPPSKQFETFSTVFQARAW